ncbi:MAG: hypothetical protein ABH824_06555 [Nanoarchaeota archaeon]|nr:hypothetical protein [Nanoarchaeota archaeon]MBU1632033.1 hypothetical protein [Nanoarchaeota archaeon]MBU1875959.1 hypothetical protein [Nanoarchaeota archaeon]
MEFIDERTIGLGRELSDLDNFVLKFTDILQKHISYVLISGYVAIIFGRSRTTEDVDLFIERLSKEHFINLYDDLIKNGFWTINTDDVDELYSMLNDNLAIRFAEKNKSIPNIEMKFIKDTLDRLALNDKIKVVTKKGELWVSNIEMQIAYKKYVLASDKDKEDALHLQNVFNISEEKINKYKVLLKQYGRI